MADTRLNVSEASEHPVGVQPDLSVVIPIYCEVATIPELYRRLTAVLAPLGLSYEVVFVDDGSTDSSAQEIARIAAEDPRICGFRFSRNFGLQAAVTAGLQSAGGRAVVLMDGDLQDPPELIPELLARWREGFDVVYTKKISRTEGPIKRAAFDLFYRLYNRLADTPITPGAGLFSLMDARVVEVLRRMPEQYRFTSGLRTWVGFRQCEVPFHRAARLEGEPRQTITKLVHMALDAMFSFSTIPLRLAAWFGLLLSLGAFGAAAIISSIRVFTNLAIPGWASILSAVLLIGGVQLIFLGVIGEYIGRVYNEVKRRPYYIIAESIGGQREPKRTTDGPGQYRSEPGVTVDSHTPGMRRLARDSAS